MSYGFIYVVQKLLTYDLEIGSYGEKHNFHVVSSPSSSPWEDTLERSTEPILMKFGQKMYFRIASIRKFLDF